MTLHDGLSYTSGIQLRILLYQSFSSVEMVCLSASAFFKKAISSKGTGSTLSASLNVCSSRTCSATPFSVCNLSLSIPRDKIPPVVQMRIWKSFKNSKYRIHKWFSAACLVSVANQVGFSDRASSCSEVISPALSTLSLCAVIRACIYVRSIVCSVTLPPSNIRMQYPQIYLIISATYYGGVSGGFRFGPSVESIANAMSAAKGTALRHRRTFTNH